MGLTHFVESQGWLAAAIRSDPALADKEPTLRFDDDIYFTTLDLSRPLPASWQFVKSARSISWTVGIGILALLGVALLKDVVPEVGFHGARDFILERTEKGRSVARWPVWGRHVSSLAMLAFAAAALYFVARSRATAASSAIFVAVGTIVFAIAVMRLRARAARRAASGLAHYSWVPALVVSGIVTTLRGVLGVPFAYAPSPFTERHAEVRRLHALGPILLGSVALVLLVMARLTRVPLTFELGFAALIMTASILAPVQPHDGGYLGRLVHRCSLVAVAVVALLIGTHVI
jgi:hypothetical protein